VDGQLLSLRSASFGRRPPNDMRVWLDSYLFIVEQKQ